MAASRTDGDGTESAGLTREALVPAAREPRDHAAGEGWGSAYPDPIEQREDSPLLGRPPVEDEPQDGAGGEPRRASLPDENNPAPSPAARDFRRDEP